MELIELLKQILTIPSPSMKEEKVAQKIVEIFTRNGIEAKLDNYGNVYAKIETQNQVYSTIETPGLLLSAHMDVVGDDTPVNIIENGKFIKTDKKELLEQMIKQGLPLL